MGIEVIIKKKRPTYIESTEAHVADNVLNRQFIAKKSNQKWCTECAMEIGEKPI